MTITAFDPMRGRGAQLARFSLAEDQGLGSDHLLLCDLSPNGSRLALARSPTGPIEIYSLRSHSMFTIPVHGLDPLRHLIWAADSPDGRHLAIYEAKQNANMFMMENF